MPRKLSTKIILIVGTLLFFAMSLVLAYVVVTDKDILLKKSYSDAAAINRRIFASMTEIMALGASDSEAIHNVIRGLRAAEEKDKESDILEIRLIHRPDIADTFIDKQIAGRYRSDISEYTQGEAEENALLGREFKGEVLAELGGKKERAVKYVTPVKVEARCLACHKAKEGEVIAALSSVISLEHGYALIKKKTVIYISGFIFAFIFIAFVLYFSLYKLVIFPIQLLAQAVSAIAKYDNLSVEIETGSNDEIGQLARDFDDMVAKLRISRNEMISAKELTEAIVEGVEEGVMLLSRDYKILWVNKKVVQMSGLSNDEILNSTCYKVTHHLTSPCAAPLDLCPMDDVLKTGKSKAIEHKHYDREGNELVVEVVVHPIKDDKGNIIRFIHISRDITAKKMLEADLMQTEKMSALGLLSIGVAHEIKNPLAIISQGLDYLNRSDTKDIEKQSEVLVMLKDAIKRAEVIIQDLLVFSRKSALEVKPEDINKVFDFSLELAKNNPDFRAVKVVREYGDGLPNALVDRVKIQQVFLNIILNAFQAMSGDGILMVRTYIETLGEIGAGVGRRAEDSFQVGEKVVCVEIEDSGPGISEEKISKIFTPFFTTKGPGKGVGLGLSICKTIVDSHKGLIRVESPKGRGAKFIIILPVAK